MAVSTHRELIASNTKAADDNMIEIAVSDTGLGFAGDTLAQPYRKDEEIYGEGEPSEYVYQVARGAVRIYKPLNDRRRQIGAFHLPGDVFRPRCRFDPLPDC